MSDLGTMLGSYTGWASALVRDEPGPLSLRTGTWATLDAWRHEARTRVRELMAGPEVVAPEARTLSVANLDGLRVEHLAWQLPYGPETRAVLLRPQGTTGKLPGVVALHDHGGIKAFGYRKIAMTTTEPHPFLVAFQKQAYGGRAWANELARRGYAVLVHDGFLFGSRRILARDLPPVVVERMLDDPLHPHEMTPGDARERPPDDRWDLGAWEAPREIERYDAFAAAHESIVAKSLFSAGTTWPGMVFADDRAALDVLAARQDVDARRLGCAGLSGGGLRTNLLAGLDDRIRCAVSVGFMTTWRDFLRSVSHTHTWMVYVPHLPRYLDYPEILGLRTPSPALVQVTTEDPLYTQPEIGRAETILKGVYQKAKAPDALRFSRYPGPHKFDVPMQEEAFDWMDQWLRR